MLGYFSPTDRFMILKEHLWFWKKRKVDSSGIFLEFDIKQFEGCSLDVG
jgi:hypothetical protein